MVDPETQGSATRARVHDVRGKSLRGIGTRTTSPTQGAVTEFVIGTQNPMLVQIPAGVYHGSKCLSAELSLVVNVPTEPYAYAGPDELRIQPDGTLSYDWSRKDG